MTSERLPTESTRGMPEIIITNISQSRDVKRQLDIETGEQAFAPVKGSGRTTFQLTVRRGNMQISDSVSFATSPETIHMLKTIGRLVRLIDEAAKEPPDLPL